MIKHITIYLSKYKRSLQTWPYKLDISLKWSCCRWRRDSERPRTDPSEVILLWISLPLLWSMVLSTLLIWDLSLDYESCLCSWEEGSNGWYERPRLYRASSSLNLLPDPIISKGKVINSFLNQARYNVSLFSMYQIVNEQNRHIVWLNKQSTLKKPNIKGIYHPRPKLQW